MLKSGQGTNNARGSKRSQAISRWTGLLAMALFVDECILIAALEYAIPGFLRTHEVGGSYFRIGRSLITLLEQIFGMSICLAVLSVLFKPKLRACVTLLLN